MVENFQLDNIVNRLYGAISRYINVRNSWIVQTGGREAFDENRQVAVNSVSQDNPVYDDGYYSTQIANWLWNTRSQLASPRIVADVRLGRRKASDLKGENLRIYNQQNWYTKHVIPIREQLKSNLSGELKQMVNEKYNSKASTFQSWYNNRRKSSGTRGAGYRTVQHKDIWYWLRHNPSRILGGDSV